MEDEPVLTTSRLALLLGRLSRSFLNASAWASSSCSRRWRLSKRCSQAATSSRWRACRPSRAVTSAMVNCLLCCAVFNASQCLPFRFRRIGLAALKSMWGAAVVLVGPAERGADAVELLGARKLSRTVCTQIWRQRGWPSTVAPGAGFVRLSAALLDSSPIMEPLNVGPGSQMARDGQSWSSGLTGMSPGHAREVVTSERFQRQLLPA